MVYDTSSQAGLASARIRLGAPTEDEETAGAYWCSYGTRHAINESCNCAPQNVLAHALPDHPLMDQWATERAEFISLQRSIDAQITPAVLAPLTRAITAASQAWATAATAAREAAAALDAAVLNRS